MARYTFGLPFFCALVMHAHAQTLNTCFPPSSSSFQLGTAADTSAFPSSCEIVEGNIDITCTAPVASGGISSFNFMSNVKEIKGSFTIRDCDFFVNFAGLEKLTTIHGNSVDGLVIINNDNVQTMQGLENLQSISSGGVRIFNNENLCFVDLFDFSRITSGQSLSGSLINFAQEPARCVTLECSAECSCGTCASSTTCIGDCSPSEMAPGVIAGIVIGSLCGLLLIILLVYLCWSGWCRCRCHCSRAAHQSVRVAPLSQKQKKKRAAAKRKRKIAAAKDDSTAALIPLQSMAGTDTEPRTVPLTAETFSPQEPATLADPEPAGESKELEEKCICGKVAEFDCSRCGKQGYCSSACQRSHWKEHREECKKAVRAAKDTARNSTADAVGTCVVCEKQAEFECSRCGGPSYCSAKCQREHWRDHAAECKNKKRGSVTSLLSSTGASPAPATASPARGSGDAPTFESPGRLGHPHGVPLPAIEENE